MAMAQARDEVLAIEKRLWEGDGDFYREAMDDQAISVMEPMGFIPKDKAVEMTKQTDGFTDLQMHDLNVVELSPDCVALAYHGEAKDCKSGKPYRGAISSVHVRR